MNLELYKIVQAGCVSELERKVNELMNAGYKCLGGVCTVTLHVFLQAMIWGR